MNKNASKVRVICTTVITLAMALVAIAAASCGSNSDTAADTATQALTEADNGKSITVNVGDTISVVLAGNPTTGYQWDSALTEEEASLLTLNGGEPTYLQDTTGTGAGTGASVVGSGGKYTFTFTAAAAGKVELNLEYGRSFEPQAEPAQSFTASITIK